MLDLFVILTPLLLLGVMFLLGFVGCASLLGVDDISYADALAITTPRTLPQGTVGVSYPDTPMNATNGTPPYIWTEIGGDNFPPGIDIDPSGLIHGTPLAAGSYSQLIQVTDKNGTGTAVSDYFKINVNPAVQPGVPPPTVIKVVPASGSVNGGTAVTVTGANFQVNASVTFGGPAATGVAVTSSTKITAITPPHPQGQVPVAVTNPDSQNDTLPNGFNYTSAPTMAFVQMQANLSAAVTLSKPATPGNLLVAAVSHASAGSATVKDNLGNSFNFVGGRAWYQGQAELFFLPNIVGGNVTVTATNVSSQLNICVAEYSGAVSLVNPSTNSSPSSGPAGPENISGIAITPLPGDSIFIAVFATQSASNIKLAAGAGFTAQSSPQDAAALVEDTIGGALGSVGVTQIVATANVPGGNFIQWVALAAEIKA